MIEQDVRPVLVEDDGRLVAIVSAGDLVGASACQRADP
jgi:CBS domain-containing protein